MIKLAIFDLAGTTVLDEGGIVVNQLDQAFREAGYEIDREEINATMGTPKRLAIADLTGAEPDEVDEIHERFRELMIAFYRESPDVSEIPGITNLFETLKREGILIAIDTGFDRETTDAVLSRMPWTHLIDGSIASDEVQNGRPHADLVEALMERLDVADSQDVAKIGDTPSDLGEGMAAHCGMVIGVTYGSHSRDQLERHFHTNIVDSVEELKELLTSTVAAHA